MLINSGVFPTIKPTINNVKSTYTIIVIIPVPTPPGIAWTNIARKNAVTDSEDITDNSEFTAHVFVPKDVVSNNALPKLPNLVSSSWGPFSLVRENDNRTPNPINIVIRIDIPLPNPINLA